MGSSFSGQNQDLLAGDWSEHFAQSSYGPDYNAAGYNAYMSKSIDLSTPSQVSALQLFNLNSPQQGISPVNNINYTNSQVSGSLGDIIQVGNITIDGSIGRITIYDGSQTEVVRIGLLDDI